MKQTVPLQEGSVLATRRMVGTEGTPFPRHTASLESALIILEGSCTITLPDETHELRPGDTFVVPAGVLHQVVGTPDFVAVHVMPRDIRFDFTAGSQPTA